MEIAQSVRRTSEIEEVTNLYFIHPISARLTLIFAGLGIAPNAISLAGMLFGVLAGFAYYHYHAKSAVLMGFILMIAWHVMDGADGQLARLTKRQSEFGKVLDGVCDYVTFIAVYVALALALSAQEGDRIWLLVIAAGICHAVQSAAYEAQRQEYEFWGWGRGALESVSPNIGSRPVSAGSLGAAAHWLHDRYTGLQWLVSGISPEFHARLTRRLKAGPQHAEEIRKRYRDTFAPVLRRMSVLSANYRTMGIFLAALFGVPQYYFWFEIMGFSVIATAFLVRLRARHTRFLNMVAQT